MTTTAHQRMLRLLALLFAFALVASACGGSDDDSSAETTDATESADETEDHNDDAMDDDAMEDDAMEDDSAMSDLPDLGGRNVTVGVENAYLPFNYIPVGGDAGEGWDYDAWNEICRLLNCNAEFVAAGWPDVIDQVAQGELDTAADGISITDERKEIVDFSDPYMTVQQKFIVGLDDDLSLIHI